MIAHFHNVVNTYGNTRKGSASMSISENIKKLREGKGISMAELAECAGVAPPQIAKYEAGINCPNAVTAVLIASRLGTTVERLVNGEEA